MVIAPPMLLCYASAAGIRAFACTPNHPPKRSYVALEQRSSNTAETVDLHGDQGVFLRIKRRRRVPNVQAGRRVPARVSSREYKN